ncbi:alpha/beta hydrolase [Microcella daejeonensis]|uniref:alpha/beta hydrolase n=1 Tax=Microcella daejeonensis TaxID=2994971 RepID=UPI002270B11B|nr:alpha/beta hydrolase [Microcella daejeonensis]WAB82925.1 alpha/beta hydrolase [Microcella daejeonensis]
MSSALQGTTQVIPLSGTSSTAGGIRLHRPPGADHGGAIVHIHGGGFFMGSAELYDDVCRELASATGCAVLAVDYRLAPEHPYPAGLDDCTAAWHRVVGLAESLGIDRDRLGLYGESAGAALAIGVCDRLRSTSERMPAILVLHEPVTDDRLDHLSSQRFTATPIWNRSLAEWSWSVYLGEHYAAPPAEAAPARLADFLGFPPTFISTRDLDPLRDEGLALARRMIDDEVPVELRHYAGTLHGTLGFAGAPVRERILRDAAEYVSERLASGD